MIVSFLNIVNEYFTFISSLLNKGVNERTSYE